MALDGKNGLNEAFAVTRNIPVGDAAAEALEAAARNLAALDGVAHARVVGQGRLQVRYDTSRLGFWDIERMLDEAGVARATGLWWRMKSEWFRYTDRNSRDNVQHVAACCSKPPAAPGGPQGR
jgi:hypothetical protein